MKKYMIFSFGVLLFLFFLPVSWGWSAETDALHLAVASPFTGRNSANGRAVKQGVSLYFDEVNEKGGIDGKEVVLTFYDDGDTGEKAKEVARAIAKEGRALAVIGHESSSCSMAAGPVYQNAEIVALSPTSTDVRVTQGNPWYFRMTFNNDFQGEFLAHYIQTVFKKKRVSIIHEDLAYGAKLAEVFGAKAKSLGLLVERSWEFQVADPKLDARLDTIVEEVKALGEEAGLLFVALHPPEGKKLIRRLRDKGVENTVLFAAGLSSPDFLKGFQELPKEKGNPGYYTNGMYAASGVIFDTANETVDRFKVAFEEAYGEPPNRRAAFAYDAAKVLHQALEKGGIKGTQESLALDRKKIQGWLRGVNSSLDAVEGITGLTFFNEEGDPHKPITVGLFKNRTLISAPVQLSEIRSLSEISDVDRALAEGRVVRLGERFLYLTSVVYTGLKLKKIQNIDVRTRTFDAEFFLWFRYNGTVHPETIEFMGTAEPISMGAPVEEKKEAHIRYALYQVKGRFLMDSTAGSRVSNQQTLSFAFRHEKLPRSNLIYVTDVLGMVPSDAEVASLQKAQLISPSERWRPTGLFFCQGLSQKESLGHPDFLGMVRGMVDHSKFMAGLTIEKSEIQFRRNVSFSSALYMVGGALLFFLAGWVPGFRPHAFFPGSLAAAGAFLVGSEVLALGYLAAEQKPHFLDLTVFGFDMLWWVVPGIFLIHALSRYIWDPLEARTGRSIPNLVRRFVAFIIWLLVFFAIVAFVFDRKITSLLATSGIITMIIGLAIQVNIANIFSGIAINLERPFQIGDFIRINDLSLGKVMDITWRTTRIQTSDNNIINIPNSMASESVIENFSRPDEVYELSAEIHLAAHHPPEKVEKILVEAMESMAVCEGTEVVFRFTDWACTYKAHLFLKDHTQRTYYQNLLSKTLWKALAANGIRPVTPGQRILETFNPKTL